MLDHIDYMLIVPPRLEINDNDDDNNNDGKFHDDDMNLL